MLFLNGRNSKWCFLFPRILKLQYYYLMQVSATMPDHQFHFNLNCCALHFTASLPLVPLSKLCCRYYNSQYKELIFFWDSKYKISSSYRIKICRSFARYHHRAKCRHFVFIGLISQPQCRYLTNDRPLHEFYVKFRSKLQRSIERYLCVQWKGTQAKWVFPKTSL